MSDSIINDQQRLAIVERIACHTVGIAVASNTGVGTGTLVSANGEHFVVTAAHVVKGVDAQAIRFWVRPPAPIIERSAKNLTPAEIGRLTAGKSFPIEGIDADAAADIAAIKIASNFRLPAPNQFYDLGRSIEFADWSDDKLDGLSLIYFGFPVANSLPIGQVKDRDFHYVGCAHGMVHYEKTVNTEAWKDLPSSYFPEKDFLLEYSTQQSIDPQGLSGCGVWIASVNPNSSVWSSEPILIGVVRHYFRRQGLLAATKVSHFLQAATRETSLG